MNTLKITFTSFLLLATASVTQSAGATGVQTPNFLTALATANEYNRAGNTAYDPNCEHGENGERGPAQARIWDAKLIDHDGDGVPDEDRERSSNPSVGRVLRGNGSLNSTSFVVGRRHLVTVSHAFAQDGAMVSGHDQMYVEVEACGNKRYEIKRKQIGTTSQVTPQESVMDYAVIELTEDLCPAASALAFGSPEYAALEGEELAATGYYTNAQVGVRSQSVASNGNNFEGQTNAEDIPGLNYEQYSSYGFVDGTMVVNEQRVDRYMMGQSFGGSGGPILAMLDGEPVVVGMQFKQPGEGRNYNFSLAAEGPFLEFVRAHVPDLRINSSGTDI